MRIALYPYRYWKIIDMQELLYPSKITLALPQQIFISSPEFAQANLGWTTLVGLAKHIVDLVMVRPPDYAVIDALVGISSGDRAYPYLPGPKGRMRAILAGKDPVAVDTVACMAMNYEPRTIGHLVFASAVGLGILDPNKIEIRGMGIEPFRQDFPIPVANSWYVPGRYGQTPKA